MVAFSPEARQRTEHQLSPSFVVAIVMLMLIALAVFLTYRRAMVTHDFLITDDTEEVSEEDI